MALLQRDDGSFQCSDHSWIRNKASLNSWDAIAARRVARRPRPCLSPSTIASSCGSAHSHSPFPGTAGGRTVLTTSAVLTWPPSLGLGLVLASCTWGFHVRAAFNSSLSLTMSVSPPLPWNSRGASNASTFSPASPISVQGGHQQSQTKGPVRNRYRVGTNCWRPGSYYDPSRRHPRGAQQRHRYSLPLAR